MFPMWIGIVLGSAIHVQNFFLPCRSFRRTRRASHLMVQTGILAPVRKRSTPGVVAVAGRYPGGMGGPL